MIRINLNEAIKTLEFFYVLAFIRKWHFSVISGLETPACPGIGVISGHGVDKQ